jgi:5'-nucleotidase
MHNKYLRISMAVLMTIVLTAGLFSPVFARVGRTVDVQILAINDFHGALLPPSGSGGRIGSTNAGGIEYLATHLRMRETKNTLFLSAGDLIGASPLISALFHDEPTIEALSLLGMDYSAVGNHEFDEGWEELLRLQYGGCHPEDGCFGDSVYPGAGFDFLQRMFLLMQPEKFIPAVCRSKLHRRSGGYYWRFARVYSNHCHTDWRSWNNLYG